MADAGIFDDEPDLSRKAFRVRELRGRDCLASIRGFFGDR